MAIDGQDNLYFYDVGNARIRKTLSTFALEQEFRGAVLGRVTDSSGAVVVTEGVTRPSRVSRAK
jgi:hypothetical protein